MSSARELNLYSPLFPAAISFGAGIIAFLSGGGWWICAVAASLAIFFIISGRSSFALLLMFFIAGSLDSWIQQPGKPAGSVYGQKLVMSGVIVEEKEGETSHNLIVRIDSIGGHSCGKFDVMVNCWNFLSPEMVTDRITFAGKLRQLESSNDLPYEIDYSDILSKKGIAGVCSISADDIISVSKEKGIRYSIVRLRYDISELIIHSEMSDFTRELLVTLLTGDREILPADMREIFSHAGVAHILALSGLHVAIISLIVMIMLWPLVVLNMRRMRSVTVIVVLWIFAVMTGLAPSVVRAVVMATMLLLTGFLERRPAPLNSLCFAAIVIMLFDPYSIFSIGFQLSFLSVLSILLLAGRLNPVSPRNRILYYPVSILTLSFSAMIATGILASFYFNIFPLYFLIANIPAALLLPLIAGGGVVYVILAALSFPVGWIESTLDFLCRLIEIINRWVAGLPGATVEGAVVSETEAVLYLVFLGTLIYWLYRPRRVSFVISLLILAMLAAVRFNDNDFSPEGQIYLPHFSGSTNLIVADGRNMIVFTTAPRPDRASLKDVCESRYRSFMIHSGIDSIDMRDGTDKIISINDVTFCLAANNDVTLPADTIDYLVICKGFTSDPAGTARQSVCKNIILSSDLHPKRRERYKNELHSIGLPYIDHADTLIVINTNPAL